MANGGYLLNSSFFFVISDASFVFNVFVLMTVEVNVPIFIFMFLVNLPHNWSELKDFVKKI